ncbi:hypothetical protein [Pseudomonas sp. SM4]|jgi:antitoxin (DNA-binding transcriptional repressor) of toxin-antitoxin stability system|uniref:hypothetical protein n=1 Tax=Pseudomonas sp. SM4 TaxID=3424177 RepID=UPI003F7B3442
MNFSSKPQEELSELLEQGASIEIAVGARPIAELIMLAVHAREGRGQLVLKATSNLDHKSFVSLSTYGKGHLLFKD